MGFRSVRRAPQGTHQQPSTVAAVQEEVAAWAPHPASSQSGHGRSLPSSYLNWAHRSNKVFLTIDLPDTKDVNLKLEPEGKFVFSATKDGVPYEIDIQLMDKVNVERA